MVLGLADRPKYAAARAALRRTAHCAAPRGPAARSPAYGGPPNLRPDWRITSRTSGASVNPDMR